MNSDPPAFGGAAYHCLQAAETLLKGFLVQAGLDFRRTHDLVELGALVLSRFPFIDVMLRGIEHWTLLGVAYGYPGDEVPEPEPEADNLLKALAVIGELREKLRSMAPVRDSNA